MIKYRTIVRYCIKYREICLSPVKCAINSAQYRIGYSGKIDRSCPISFRHMDTSGAFMFHISRRSKSDPIVYHLVYARTVLFRLLYSVLYGTPLRYGRATANREAFSASEM